MIRLIALDIDGTLLDSEGRVPEANRHAIARAMDAGVLVTLATGRRYDFARPIFEQLPGGITLILSNGAVVKTRDGETIVRHLLPREVARDVLRRVPHTPGEASVTFDRPREGQVVFEAIDWEHPRHQRFFETNRPFLSAVSPLEDCLTEDPIQVMFSGGCAEMRRVFQFLQAPVNGNGSGADHYEVTLTEYLHRDFSLVDVTRAGCSKGSALGELAAQRGIPPHEVMAIGDNLNDLAMLEFAGRPVLMANALPELKARGWAVTGSNDEAGVAEAIETFVLGGAS
jgi:hypothetical protein